MTVLLAAGLAAAAAALLVGRPAAGGQRLAAFAPRTRRPSASGSWQALVVLALPGVLAVGPVAALLGAGGVLAAGRWTAARRATQAREAERQGALHACRTLAAELSAGRAPADALAAAGEAATGPAAEALRSAASAAGVGADVPAALVAGAERSAVAPVLRALAACWTVCAASGSGLAAAVSRLEEGLRADQAQRRAVDAELAGPRATAVLLALLPAGGLLMAGGLGADPLHVLLETPVGVTCLLLGLLLDGLGVLWTQRLVARVRPP